MASGVGSHFVGLLSAEVRQSTRQLGVALAVALLLAAPAYFLAPPLGLAIHGAGLLLGVLVGLAHAHRLTRSCESTLRTSWNEWMRYAVGCETVWQVHRRVRGKGLRNLPYLWAAGLALLWVLEMALLLLALRDNGDILLALPVLLVNGAVAGYLVGRSIRLRTWTGKLRDSVGDMVASGELGVWGVM